MRCERCGSLPLRRKHVFVEEGGWGGGGDLSCESEQITQFGNETLLSNLFTAPPLERPNKNSNLSMVFNSIWTLLFYKLLAFN
jgi:hypothetical protein